jgi:hypothetical protein
MMNWVLSLIKSSPMSALSVLISFLALCISFTSAVYAKRRTDSLARQITLVRLNACFQILDSARQNYLWNPGYHSIAKRLVAGHIIYGEPEALFVKGESSEIPESGGTLILRRLVDRLLLVEMPAKLSRRSKRKLQTLFSEVSEPENRRRLERDHALDGGD